jgi:hypothetical protein
MLGNTKLIDYGIQTEESDLRVHVCPKIGRVYYYNTSDGLATIRLKDYKKMPVFTNSIKTAEGFVVPPSDIPGCVELKPSITNWNKFFNQTDTTSKKGDLAVRLVKAIIKNGELKLTLNPIEITDLNMQISGTDIIVKSNIRIQVKCDFNGGSKQLGGTGNLFLQVSECNPFKQV